MNKMKKGFYGPLIIVIALAVILIAEMVVVSTVFKKERTEHRLLLEASLISQSDKVETYVRSFQRATDLSLLQSIHDVGSGNIALPYDSDARYSSDPNYYMMPYWQIYTDWYYDVSILPTDISQNKLKQQLSWISSSYQKNYRNAFQSFSGGEFQFSPDIEIPKVKELTDLNILIQTDKLMLISKETSVEGQSIAITRDFYAYSDIRTKFNKALGIAIDIVEDNELGGCVKDTEDDTRGDLTTLAGSKSSIDSDIEVIFDLKDYVGPPNPKALINVLIYDKTMDYTLYFFPDNEVKIDFLGLNFLVKAGDSTGGDSWPVDTADSLAQNCNRLEVMSSQAICSSFTILPENYKVCDDPDPNGYTTKNTCVDFTGEYTDLCFDSDGDGTDDTIYEYDCYTTSEICHYIEHGCISECQNGACGIACTQDTDCLDANICTQDVCTIGATPDQNKCDNPPEPSTVSCGSRSRDCSSGNCGCVGDDWICEIDTDKACTRRCDGAGSCGCGDCNPPGCEPDQCDTVDRGCCADSDCPSSTPLCDLSTHTCARCLSDDDCLQDGDYCDGDTLENRDYSCNAGTGECEVVLLSSEDCDSYDGSYCNNGIREDRVWSCTGTGPNAFCDPTITDSENCDSYDGRYCYASTEEIRDYSCSGEPNANCNSYTYSNREQCEYGCKSGRNRCIFGYDCEDITCSYYEEKWCCLKRCIGQDSCTISGCYSEIQVQWQIRPGFSRHFMTCDYWCDFTYECWFLCSEGLCYWNSPPCTCTSTCTLSETCTYE